MHFKYAGSPTRHPLGPNAAFAASIQGGAQDGRLARTEYATETAEAEIELIAVTTGALVKNLGAVTLAIAADGTPPTAAQIFCDTR